MTGSGTFGIGATARGFPLRAVPLRAKGPKDARDFHGEREGECRSRAAIAADGPREDSSQFETDRAPDWRNAWLNCAFVAQVLGQMLTKNEYDRSAFRVYGERMRALSLGLDLSA